MKILVTGRGGAGSWAIRGDQIGAALGADVAPMATLDAMRAADVILAVKRVPPQLLADIRRSGRPWVYDIVDAYPQPACTSWSRADAIAWVQALLADLQPTAVIWPTERMRDDVCGGAAGAGAVVHHHCRPGIERNPVRDRIGVLGYEGCTDYLAGWQTAIAQECRRLRLQFVANPARLADVDIVLALRGPAHNGYVQRHWKSGVKLANAHGSGTPFVGGPECGYRETATGGEAWVESDDDLRAALTQLSAAETRRAVAAAFLAAARTVDTAAAEVRTALEEAICSTAPRS